MHFSLKSHLVRFLFILFVLIGFGFVLRLLYHYIPGCIDFVSNSWAIDIFYRILLGPVHRLLTLSGVDHTLGYAKQASQYYIYLPNANITLFLWIPCLGISLMYVYTALIIAFPNPWKKKLVFIVAGNVIIQVMNIFRIYGLSLLINHTQTVQTRSAKLPWIAINHETIFNYGVILLIFLMFVFYARRSRRIQE